jgi:hypothetical protein
MKLRGSLQRVLGLQQVLLLVVNRAKASRDLAQAVLTVAARDHSCMESARSVI